MIRIFRTIRKKLLQSNELSRYMAYAIGEILLVMIGILLALQVNNWNEKRKEKIMEEQILEELRTSLSDDLGLFQILLERSQEKSNNIDNALNYLNETKVVNDSVFFPYYLRMTQRVTFSYNNGAYESLKNIGITIISDHHLRQMIQSLFGSTLPRTKSFIDEDDPITEAKREELQSHFMNRKLIKQGNKQWWFDGQIDYNDLLNNSSFSALASMEMIEARNYIRRLEHVIKETEIVIEALSKSIMQN